MKANDKRIETTLANDDGRLKFLESWELGTGGAAPTNRVARPRAFPCESNATITDEPSEEARQAHQLRARPNIVRAIAFHLFSIIFSPRFLAHSFRFNRLSSMQRTSIIHVKYIFRICNNEPKNNAFLFSLIFPYIVEN